MAGWGRVRHWRRFTEDVEGREDLVEAEGGFGVGVLPDSVELGGGASDDASAGGDGAFDHVDGLEAALTIGVEGKARAEVVGNAWSEHGFPVVLLINGFDVGEVHEVGFGAAKTPRGVDHGDNPFGFRDGAWFEGASVLADGVVVGFGFLRREEAYGLGIETVTVVVLRRAGAA